MSMDRETLVLTANVHAVMLDQALSQYPHEACGLFTGPVGALRADGYHPMTNAADPEKASELYVLDGQEMLAAEVDADARGAAVLGVVHSHTRTSAYPSPTDVADAANFDPFGAWMYVIVSLKHHEPALRAYRINAGVIREVQVVIEDG